MIEHDDAGSDPSSWDRHDNAEFEALDAAPPGTDLDTTDGDAVTVDIGGASLLVPDDGPDSAAGLSLTDADGATWEIGGAELASDGGAADSVVTYTATGAEVFSDLDGDGQVDQIVRVAGDGELIVWHTDADGAWQLTGTGEVDALGGVQLWPFGVDGDSSAPQFGDVPADHIAVATDGADFTDAGAPQYDMDGDGTPETAIVETDGRMLQYSDTDGDGRADQLLQISTDDRSATILVDDGTGWEITATGRIDDDGDFVPDDGATPVGLETEAPPAIEVTVPGSTGAVTIGPPDQDIDGDGVAESVAVRAPDGHLLIVSDTDADGSADQLIDVDQESGKVSWMTLDDDGEWIVAQHGHMTPDGGMEVDGQGPPDGLANAGTVTVSVDGRSFPAGPASIDTDGNGVADTVAVPGVGGSTQYYQDSDGDGIADRAWTVHADGARGQEYRIDDDGQWVPSRTAPHDD